MDSFIDAAGNGQRVDDPNVRSQDPSAQTGNVHEDEEAIIPPASDDLEVNGDKQGVENSHEHHHSNSHF